MVCGHGGDDVAEDDGDDDAGWESCLIVLVGPVA